MSSPARIADLDALEGHSTPVRFSKMASACDAGSRRSRRIRMGAPVSRAELDMSTTKTGNVGEARVALELAKRGYEIHRICGTGGDLLAIMPGVGSWTVQVKTTSETGHKGSRTWQQGASARLRNALSG